MISSRLHSIVLALAVATWPVGVSAQDQAASALAEPQRAPSPPPDPGPRSFGAPPSHRVRIGGRVDTTISTLHQYNPDGTLNRAPFSANLATVDADFGEAFVRVTVPFYAAAGQGVLGDLLLEGFGDVAIGREHRLLIGGGVALPTATDPERGGCAPSATTGCDPGTAFQRQHAWSISYRDAPGWADQTLTVWPSIDYTLGVPWFLLHALGTAPVFLPIDPSIGGPQPVPFGRVQLMLTLEVSAALRILDFVDVGAAFLGWAIPSQPDAMFAARGPLTCTVGGLCTSSPGGGLPGAPLAEAAVSAFVRTDPVLDSPVGGGVEFIYGWDSWYYNGVYARTFEYNPWFAQPWGVHAHLTVRGDIAY